MKTPHISLRVDPERKAKWETAAQLCGMSLSGWLSWMADKACDGPGLPEPVKQRKAKSALCSNCERKAPGVGIRGCPACDPKWER